MGEVTYRWANGPDASDEDWDQIESILAARGWMSLNREASIRILIAEKDGAMGFFIFQWLPYCGPMFLPPSMRGGEIANELATKMLEFLIESQARGWVIVADSPHAVKMCEAFDMSKIKSPLYAKPDPGGMEI